MEDSVNKNFASEKIVETPSLIKCYIYVDEAFLDSIYIQQFDELPDIGVIEYINSKSIQKTKQYSSIGEFEKRYENIQNREITEKLDKAFKDENRTRVFGEMSNSDVYGDNYTRIFTNIEEMKAMKNVQKQKNMIDSLIYEARRESNKKLVNEVGKINLYDNCITNELSQESREILVQFNNKCLWLKKEYIDADLKLMSNLLNNVNVLAYVVSEATNDVPQIIKAIVVYV